MNEQEKQTYDEYVESLKSRLSKLKAFARETVDQGRNPVESAINNGLIADHSGRLAEWIREENQ